MSMSILDFQPYENKYNAFNYKELKQHIENIQITIFKHTGRGLYCEFLPSSSTDKIGEKCGPSQPLAYYQNYYARKEYEQDIKKYNLKVDIKSYPNKEILSVFIINIIDNIESEIEIL